MKVIITCTYCLTCASMKINDGRGPPPLASFPGFTLVLRPIHEHKLRPQYEPHPCACQPYRIPQRSKSVRSSPRTSPVLRLACPRNRLRHPSRELCAAACLLHRLSYILAGSLRTSNLGARWRLTRLDYRH